MNKQYDEKPNKTIALIKLEFMQANNNDIPAILDKYKDDKRSGVITISNQYLRRYNDYINEVKRLKDMMKYEEKYKEYTYICGIDEVGRGPLAGPVVACAMILHKECNILNINDSKQLSKKMREQLYDKLVSSAVTFGIGSIPPARIDEINILQATYEAMRQAIGNMSIKPDILLNDAVTIPDVTIKQIPIIKGDQKSLSIAAASIVAKVTRDRFMIAYDKVFPEYGFAANKGYGSSMHIEAIRKHGLSPIHRRSFVKNFYKIV